MGLGLMRIRCSAVDVGLGLLIFVDAFPLPAVESNGRPDTRPTTAAAAAAAVSSCGSS